MKFVVWKLEEILEVCNDEELDVLEKIESKLVEKRRHNGKEPYRTYLVVNTDESYADKVKALIEENEGEEVTF